MGKRSTDGITLNKVVVSIASFSVITIMGMVSWVYTDHTANVGVFMKEVVGEVRQIREQGISLYSHVENNDAKITKLEEDNKDFRSETRRYWGQRNE